MEGRVLELERRQGNNDVRIAKQFGDGRNEVGLNELILDETSGREQENVRRRRYIEKVDEANETR